MYRYLSTKEEQKLNKWYSTTGEAEFKERVQHGHFSTDQLNYLLQVSTQNKSIERIQCLLKSNVFLNTEKPLTIAVYMKNIECINVLLPKAHLDGIGGGLQTLAQWFDPSIATILFKRIPSEHKARYLISFLEDCLYHKNLDGVEFCLKQRKKMNWNPHLVESSLVLCLDKHKTPQDHFVFNYCMAYYRDKPNCDTEPDTEIELLSRLDLNTFTSWVNTVHANYSERLLLELVHNFKEGDCFEQMRVLFQRIPIEPVLKTLATDDWQEEIDYLTKHYALYQKDVLLTHIGEHDGVAKGRQKRKI